MIDPPPDGPSYLTIGLVALWRSPDWLRKILAALRDLRRFRAE
jgi:hypothetical protein